jgi:hypothetical protein
VFLFALPFAQSVLTHASLPPHRWVEIDTDIEDDLDSSASSALRGVNTSSSTALTDASALRAEGASFLQTISPRNQRYIANNPAAMQELAKRSKMSVPAREKGKGKGRRGVNEEDGGGSRVRDEDEQVHTLIGQRITYLSYRICPGEG